MLTAYNNSIDQMIAVLKGLKFQGYQHINVELEEAVTKNPKEAKMTFFPVNQDGSAYKPISPKPKRRKTTIDPTTDLQTLL